MSLVDRILLLPFPVLNHWGYWIVLSFAILEAIPLVGLFAPGMLVVIIGGFLAKIGILELGDVIFFAATGAIMGDLIGYFLGKNYGYSFLLRYGKYFFFRKEYFDKTKKLMNHHVGKTLIIGRFNSLTRAFAPFVAGISNVPFAKFLTYNLIGGISWATSFVLVGYFFGRGYEITSKYMGGVIFFALILSIMIIYLYRFVDKKRHLFTKYHLYALIINIFSLYLFSKMVEDVVDGELVTRWDIWLSLKIPSLWNPSLNKIMIFITNMVSPLHLLILSLILFGMLLYKRKWYCSLLMLGSMSTGLLFELLIKLVMHRARPANSLIEASGYSFPSGHATIAIIFFSLMIYSFKDEIKNLLLKYIFILINVSLFLLVGFSRLYLNVHWLSDILAGFGLGLFLLTLLILIFEIIIVTFKRTLRTAKRIIEPYLPSD